MAEAVPCSAGEVATTVTPASACPLALSVTTPWTAPAVFDCAEAVRTAPSVIPTSAAAMKRFFVFSIALLLAAARFSGCRAGGERDRDGLRQRSAVLVGQAGACLLYTSPSPRDS